MACAYRYGLHDMGTEGSRKNMSFSLLSKRLPCYAQVISLDSKRGYT